MIAATLLLDRDYVRTVEASCDVCRRPGHEEERIRWGCDHDLADPYDWIDCFRCSERSREFCQTCDGEGRIPVLRCPWSYVGPRERAVVESSLFLDVNALPFGVGWSELPASFVDALELVSHERAEITRREHERQANRRS